MNFRAAVIALIGLAVALAALAQSFDAASVKIDNGPFRPGVSGRMSGGPGTGNPGRFTITQHRMPFIIAGAYDVRVDQISGPAWLDDLTGPNFSIIATMPPDATKSDFQLMLQNLLAERFHLASHHVTQDFPGYDLIVTPGGTKLKPWEPDPNGGGNQPRESTSFALGRSGIVRSIQRQSMADFSMSLGGSLNMANGVPSGIETPRVADKTGLTGIFEFKLEFEGTAVMPGVQFPAKQNARPQAIPARADQLSSRRLKINWA